MNAPNLDQPNADADPPHGLGEALADWLELVEAGGTADESAFLERFPHWKDALSGYLEDWRKVHAITNLAQCYKAPQESGAKSAVIHQTIGFRDDTLIGPEVLPSILDYEIVEELGRGGMGVVYKARQISLKRWVAIKMLRGIDPKRGADKIRFHNEAAIIAQIDHPHIVPIYHVGEQEGRPFFAMKWIEGGSLAGRLGRERSADRAGQQRAAHLVLTLARAVHYAHERGILHRDLKPSNVLLDAAGLPYVTDFGLAKRLDADGDMTQTGEVVGTPSYMAPEQATGKKNAVTTATDVYGLGAVLYALLTGRAPFHGETVLETLTMVRERDPRPPIEVDASIDRDMQTICLKCLHKDPHRRYLSAEAVAEDLDRWLHGQPILARPETSRERLVRWMRRRPAWTALIGVSVLALIGFISGLLLYNHDIGNVLAQTEGLRQAGLKREAVLKRHLYVADLRSARQHLESGDDAQALELLTRHVPISEEDEDLRGFPWHHMDAMCRYQPRVLGRHDARVPSLAVSPDDRWLATGDDKGVIKIWDLAAGAEVCILPGPTRVISGLAFSPDGKRLAAAVNQEWQIRLWEVGTWEPQAPCVGFFCSPRGVAFSPDSSHLAAALYDGNAAIWKLSNSLSPTSLPSKGPLQAVDWSPDGKQLLTMGTDGALKVWDIAQKREAFSLPLAKTSKLLTGAFHPQRRWAATGGYSTYVSLWDLSTHVETARHNTSESVRALKFAPDGAALLAVGAEGEMTLLHLPSDVRSQQVCRTHRAGETIVRGLAYVNGGQGFVTCADDGLVKLWDTARFAGVATRQFASWLRCVSCSGRYTFMHVHNQGAAIHDLHTGKIVATTSAYLHHDTMPVFSKSEKSIVFKTADHRAAIWHFASSPPRPITSSRLICSLALAPDEKTLAIADCNGAVEIWNLENAQIDATLQEGQAGIKTAAHLLHYMPDGKLLIAAPKVGNGAMAVFDVAKRIRQTVLEFPEKEIHSLTASPDGRLLAAGVGERSLHVWELADGKLKLSLVGNQKRVLAVAFSPDGKTLASACEDGTIRLWHLSTDQLLFTLHTCRFKPTQLQFDDLGQTLTAITGSLKDGELLVWKVPAANP